MLDELAYVATNVFKAMRYVGESVERPKIAESEHGIKAYAGNLTLHLGDFKVVHGIATAVAELGRGLDADEHFVAEGHVMNTLIGWYLTAKNWS
jgi:hypothetical protein